MLACIDAYENITGKVIVKVVRNVVSETYPVVTINAVEDQNETINYVQEKGNAA